MRYFVEMGDRTFQVHLGPESVQVDGTAVDADLVHVEGTNVRHLLLDGASHRMVARRLDDASWEIHLKSRLVKAEAVDERTRVIREMTGTGSGPKGPRPVRAPMPGLVVKVEVEEGDTVVEGQGVAIVEAMKMENELKAESSAVVKKIHVSPGDTVDKDDVLIELAPADGEEEA